MKLFGFLAISVFFGMSSAVVLPSPAHAVMHQCADLFAPIKSYFAPADTRPGYVERLITANRKLAETSLTPVGEKFQEMTDVKLQALLALGFDRLADFNAVVRQSRTIERNLSLGQRAEVAKTIKFIEVSPLRSLAEPAYIEGLVEAMETKMRRLEYDRSRTSEDRGIAIFHLRYAVEKLKPAAKYRDIRTKEDFEQELANIPLRLSQQVGMTDQILNTIVAFSQAGKVSSESLRAFVDIEPFFHSLSPYSHRKVVFLTVDHPLTTEHARHLLLRVKTQDDPEMSRAFNQYEDMLKAKDLIEHHRRHSILSDLSGIH